MSDAHPHRPACDQHSKCCAPVSAAVVAVAAAALGSVEYVADHSVQAVHWLLVPVAFSA